MKILVIVVTYNGLAWVDRCLGSVTGADLLVVDNASSDGTADRVAARFPEAVLVRSRENLGFGRANNLGMRYAHEHGYDAVYLLNQDAWLLPDTLERLSAAMEDHPDYAVLSPLQMQAGGVDYDPLFAAHVLPKAGPLQDGVREVPRVMAAHWLVSRAAWEKVGFFAPLIPLYSEDDNYCDRVRYHRMKVGIVPAAAAVHDRAFRVEALDKVVRRNYFMGSLCRLCNINRPLWERMLYVFLFTAVKTVKYRSLLPFRYFRQIVGKIHAIREMRRATAAPGAYLTGEA